MLQASVIVDAAWSFFIVELITLFVLLPRNLNLVHFPRENSRLRLVLRLIGIFGIMVIFTLLSLLFFEANDIAISEIILTPTPPFQEAILAPSPTIQTPQSTPFLALSTPEAETFQTQTDTQVTSEPIKIPAGVFTMGSNPADDPLFENIELPAHEVFVSEFWVQRFEVSNEDYSKCVDMSICTEPFSTSSATRSDYYTNPNFSNYPVVKVTFHQASTFCDWLEGRLPTEAEWEKAARLPNGSIYPWGNNSPLELESGYLNYDDIVGDTSPVDSGGSPNQIFNLAGNVWEWTRDWYDESYYSVSSATDPVGSETGLQKVVRGGGWSTSSEFLRAASRWFRDPENGYDNVGFRCIFTSPP